MTENNSSQGKFYPRSPAVQLIMHLSKGAYTTFAKAIREVVNNSFDAQATEVKLEFNEDRSELTISDDGTGFTAEKFDEEFLRISGSRRRDKGNWDDDMKRPIIGIYGIGVLAIAAVCEKAVIQTKVAGTTKGIVREIPFAHLFDESLKTEDLRDHFYYYKRPDFEALKDKHYTSIRLINLNKDIQDILNRPEDTKHKNWASIDQFDGFEGFKWQLGLLVPIKYQDDFPVRGLELDTIDRAKAELEAFNFRVFVNDKEIFKPVRLGHKPKTKIKWSYEKEDISALPPKDLCSVNRIESETPSGVKFYGYIYEQGRAIYPINLRGILIRVSHVGIYGYDLSFYKYPKNLGLTMSMMSGEIFVESGLDDALAMDKDSFKEHNSAFIELIRYIHGEVEKISSQIKDQSKIRNAIIKGPEAVAEYKDQTKKEARKVKDLLEAKTPTIHDMRSSVGVKEWEKTVTEKPNLSLRAFSNRLRTRISNLADSPDEEQSYLQEALRCNEKNCWRASIVMAWNAAMHRIFQKINHERNGLVQFNNAAITASSRGLIQYKTKTYRDLEYLKRRVLDNQVLAAVYVRGWFKVEGYRLMQRNLDTRNYCGHPTDYEVTEDDALLTMNLLLKQVFENPKFRVK